MLFNIEGTKLLSYIGDNTQIIISEGITIIGEEAFYGSKIEPISIPESVLVIEEDALRHAKS